MKQTKITTTAATLELTKEEIDVILYVYNTNDKVLNKKEEKIFTELLNVCKMMNTLKSTEAFLKSLKL